MGLLVAIFSVGCALGGILLAKLGDIFGRRLAIMMVVLIYVVGAIIQISATGKWYQYFVGKIIYGLGCGGCSVLCPMLLSEIAPKRSKRCAHFDVPIDGYFRYLLGILCGL